MAAQAAASDGDPSPGGHHKAAPMMDRYGQTSLLVGSWSSAEGRWVEAYQGSPSGGFGLSRYSDCGVDSCRSFYFIGQPTVRLTQSSLVS